MGDPTNVTCNHSEDLQNYQHHLYAVVYSVILAPGLLGNVLALWVFRVYIRETKKAVVFMMNLAVADLLQVKKTNKNQSVPFLHVIFNSAFRSF